MKNTLIFVLGIIVLVFAVILDMLGFNTKEGFGLIQIAGVVVGAVLIIYGLIKMGKKKS
jgi:hypothetical protein